MRLTNQSILITGGAGFIGSHLSLTLAKSNHVTIYDNFSSSVLSLNDLSDLSTLNIVNGDILDRERLSHAMRGQDVVFHLAVACVRMSLGNPVHVHDVNATGTLNTLLTAKIHKVKHFVYVSSSEVYGTAKRPLMSESHPTDPATVYGMSKLIGEQYTRYFHTHEGLATTIVRPFNTYGPRSHFDGVYGEVIPRFVVRALTGNQPFIFGDGSQSRDFTYVDDTVRGLILAAESDDLLGHTINIARGKEVSIKELAQTINTLAGLPFQPIFKPARPNDVLRHAADISKAKRRLKFSPDISISEGLKKYIEWIRLTYPDPAKFLRLIPDKNW
ncbi:GDP-mannose 4,6-dehydratase [Candidatus Gottesmanbacteria bacterium]|nr:GDP-mannose 4,6-dehydratase [Candidatus Gottesmanbacteria bacterium]